MIEDKLALIVTAIIWLSVALLALIVYFLFPPDLYYWDKVCDKCTTRTAGYTYIIRFIFGAFKQTFDITKTTITIDVMDTKAALISLTISPKQLMASQPKSVDSNLKVVRFLLYRKDPLLDVRTLVVNHNGVGSINVTTVEIQDMKAKEANIAYIGQPVNQLAKDKALITQTYPAATREARQLEPELSASQTLTSLEFIALMFLSVNAILLLSLFVIPCSDGLCKNFTEGFFRSLFTGLTASAFSALLFIVMCCIYRYGIKRRLFRAQGLGVCVWIRYLFLAIVVLAGLGLGLGAAFQASFRNWFPATNPGQKFAHEIYWLFGVGIALMVFFLFWLPILSVIAYLIGFFTEEETADSKPGPGGLTNLLENKTTRSADEGQEVENSANYYNTLIKANTKVKSISQYAGVQPSGVGGGAKGGAPVSAVGSKKPSDKPSEKQTSKAVGVPSKKPSKDKPSTKSTKVSKTPSTDSTGSGYYQQLMKKQQKVKSVSQYGGIKK